MNKPITQIKSSSEYQDITFNNEIIVGPRIDETSFYKCNFSGVDFSLKIFNKCRFEKCSFDEGSVNITKFLQSKILECTFNSCRLTGIDWSQVDSAMGFSLNCTDCQLSYSVFSGIALLKSVFKICKIHDAEFSGAGLKEVSFEGSDLLNTKFANCDLSGAGFEKAINYIFDLRENKCKKARFSRPEVENLFIPFELVIGPVNS